MPNRSADRTARTQRLIVISLIGLALGFLIVIQLRSQAAVARTLAAQDDTSVALLINDLNRANNQLIGGRSLSAPFTLLVIGDPEQLQPAADLSASTLQTRVQVNIQRKTDISITDVIASRPLIYAQLGR